MMVKTSGTELGAWLYGTYLGELQGIGGTGRVQFRFSPDSIARWGIRSPILSAHLPITTAPVDATTFIQGLLPEGAQLDKMADNAGIYKRDLIAMMANYGRDVAGAIYIADTPPPQFGEGYYQPLSLRELAQHVDASAPPVDHINRAPFEPLGNTPANRYRSLGGYQGKYLCANFNGQWYSTQDGAPSTHILKPQSLNINYRDLTQNEAATMRLAAKVGVTTTDTQWITVGDTHFMAQSRYDREVEQPFSVKRIHQEDACQALGFSPESKYQTKDPEKPGPSLKQIASVCPNQLADFLAQVTFRYIIGDTDAHAKNYSFLHLPDGQIKLAPLYDAAPALHYIGNSLAQTINGKHTYPTTTISDLIAEATTWGMTKEAATEIVTETATRIKKHIYDSDLTPANNDAWETIAERATAAIPFATPPRHPAPTPPPVTHPNIYRAYPDTPSMSPVWAEVLPNGNEGPTLSLT
jgi:serine/threonine-protein kinase HipA